MTFASGVTWTSDRSGLSLSLTRRFESGTPIQRGEGGEAELAERPGAALVDFERGRVKPRTIVSLVGALPLVRGGDIQMGLRAGVLNLIDRAYAYNFGNPFSGTHFGAPRTVYVSLEATLR